mgnify:CR=1 FL=1
MALTGNLRDFDISYIFQIVAQESKTGKLVLTSAAGEAYVVFDRGRIVWAGIGAKDLKKVLLSYIVDVKGAPYSFVRRLADQAKDDMQNLIEQFIRARYVTEHELHRVIGVVLEDLTCEMFLWRDGTYQFDVNGDIERFHAGGVSLSAEAITMEAARRMDEWERLKPIIKPQAVYVVTGAGGRQHHITRDPIDDPADYICALIDGVTTVELLCKKTFLSNFKVYEALATLLQEEKIIALSDKLSTSINDALHRDIRKRHSTVADSIVSSIVSLLAVVLIVCISMMVPGSIARREVQRAQKISYERFLQTQSQRKAAIFTLYYHACTGYLPYTTDDLVRERLLARRDISPLKNERTDE